MIRINGGDIVGMRYGAVPIIAVYINNLLVWPSGSSKQSAYASGYWIDEYPWTDDTPWTD